MYKHQYNPYGANIEIVKGYLKGGKVLFIGILYLLSIAVSFATAIMVPSAVKAIDFTPLLKGMGVDASQLNNAIDSAMPGVTSSILISTTLTSIITLLIAIGFIVMFVKSRNDDPDSNPSGGAGILRVLSLINFICAVILVLFLVFLYVAAYFSLDYFVNYYNLSADSAKTTWIITGVFLLIFCFFYLFITSVCKTFYRSVKLSLSSVDLYTRGATAYGVFNVIGAIFTALALVGSVITMIRSFSTFTLVSMLGTALSFLTCVMLASFAFGYKGYINRQKLSYAAPHDGGPTAPYYPNDYHSAPNPYAAPQRDVPPAPAENTAPSAPASCPNCGAPIEGSSPFCSNCGTKL